MARIRQMEQDEFCRKKRRAGLARRTLGRCCMARNAFEPSAPWNRRAASTRSPQQRMGAEIESPGSMPTSQIACPGTKKAPGLPATLADRDDCQWARGSSVGFVRGPSRAPQTNWVRTREPRENSVVPPGLFEQMAGRERVVGKRA